MHGSHVVAVGGLVTLLLSGCYGDVESFSKAAAKQSCNRLQECNQSAFDDRYDGDMGRCRDDVETDLLDAADALDNAGCDYVPEEGRACIKASRQNSGDCSREADQNIGDACEEVFDCPGIGQGQGFPGIQPAPEAIGDILSSVDEP